MKWGLFCIIALSACSKSSLQSILPPPSLLASCAAPVVLPDRDLSEREIELLWGRDRSALRECGSKVDGLAGR